MVWKCVVTPEPITKRFNYDPILKAKAAKMTVLLSAHSKKQGNLLKLVQAGDRIMKEILIATSNAHKVQEFSHMLKPLGFQVKSLLDIAESFAIEENGTTFEENALIKARAVYEKLHTAVISDDSGLSVDAMDGAPGVYSARFLGRDTDYQTKNNYIIEQVKGKPRGAQFVCAIAYIKEDGSEHVFTGVVEGEIAEQIEGENGFGYDPIFYYPPFHTTLANVSEEEKNRVSHRSRALQKLLAFMKEDAKR